MEKRQRSELRKALRIRKSDLEDDDTELEPGSSKRQTTIDVASIAPTLNYVGTSVAVPLSLSMAHVVAMPKRMSTGKGKDGGLVTDGLPPNAVDSEGNILVTNYDILVSELRAILPISGQIVFFSSILAAHCALSVNLFGISVGEAASRTTTVGTFDFVTL